MATFALLFGFLAFLSLPDAETLDLKSFPAGAVGLHLGVVLLLEVEADIDGDATGHENFNNAPLEMRFHINSFPPLPFPIKLFTLDEKQKIPLSQPVQPGPIGSAHDPNIRQHLR